MELTFQEHRWAGTPRETPKCLDETGKRPVVAGRPCAHRARAELSDSQLYGSTPADEWELKAPPHVQGGGYFKLIKKKGPECRGTE